MIKNQANQQISFIAINVADGLPVTTGTPTVYLALDSGSQATSTNTASHQGNGVWRLELTQGETNADHLSGVMTLTNAVNAFAQAYPLTLNDFKSDATAANQTSISNAIAGLNNFDPSSDPVANVTLVDTTTNLTNGGGGDATAANQTAISNAIAALNDFDPVADPVANVTLVNTTTNLTNGAGGDATAANQTAISNAIAALNDFDPVADTVANVSLVASVNAVPATVATVANQTSISNAIAALNDSTPLELWSALTSGAYPSGSFGERVLVGVNTNRAVQITGSNHAAADVHEFQNDAITAAAIDSSAVTELQNGLIKLNVTNTHTNQAGDTMVVTIS